MKKFKILIGFIFLAGICFGQKEEMLFQAKGYDFPYRINNPDKTWELPGKLKEISGQVWLGDGRLACIQDEKGNIYIFNTKTSSIEKKIDFEDDADYEGIAKDGKNAWVLESDGDLYHLKNFLDEETLKVKKYETVLSRKNDTEGVALDVENNRLLIACKGFPHLEDKKGTSKKAIYQFDLAEKEIIPKPLFLIDLDQIKYYKKYNTMTRIGVEILAKLDESKGDISFQPSDLAIHPFTGNLYITGAVGDLLLVFTPNGEILAMIDLDDVLYKQPEGICFDDAGNLYISNEGNESLPVLYKINLRKK